LSIEKTVSKHAGFKSLKTQQFPKPEDALGLLALWLAEKPEMRTGLPPMQTPLDLKEYLEVLDGIEPGVLPGHALLKAVANSQIDEASQLCLGIMVKELAGPLLPANYCGVLNWLSRRHESSVQGNRT